jgi:general secretion pathway protein H
MNSRSPAGNSSSLDAGFTLIELLVVIGIIALLVAIVPAQFDRSHAALQQSKAAQTLMDDLRSLHETAVAEGVTTSFVLLPEQNAYQLAPDGSRRQMPKTYRLELLSDQEDPDGNRQISFFPDGGSSGGQLRLSAANRSLTIAIHWTNGRVALNE